MLFRSKIDECSIDKFVFNKLSKKFQKDTIEALGIPENKIIESRFYPHIKADKLIVPSFTYKGGLRCPKWACDFLKTTFLKPEIILGKKNESYDRIYIKRNLAKRRLVLNEAEVVNLLDGFGFVSVNLELMSLKEQALCMANAKVVVAPHGAGLIDLVFCSQGIKVIEIFPPKYVNPIYWQISNVCALSYYYLIGELIGDDSEQPRNRDIMVDLEKLVKILKLAAVI